jgi:hypothetical protein
VPLILLATTFHWGLNCMKKSMMKLAPALSYSTLILIIHRENSLSEFRNPIIPLSAFFPASGRRAATCLSKLYPPRKKILTFGYLEMRRALRTAFPMSICRSISFTRSVL